MRRDPQIDWNKCLDVHPGNRTQTHTVRNCYGSQSTGPYGYPNRQVATHAYVQPSHYSSFSDWFPYSCRRVSRLGWTGRWECQNPKRDNFMWRQLFGFKANHTALATCVVQSITKFCLQLWLQRITLMIPQEVDIVFVSQCYMSENKRELWWLVEVSISWVFLCDSQDWWERQTDSCCWLDADYQRDLARIWLGTSRTEIQPQDL